MQISGRRAGRSRRHVFGALLVSVSVVGGALDWTASAGANISNPGAISVHFAGTLSINTAVAVVIPGITGDATGSIDAAGNIALPQANISFATFPVTVAGVLPTTVGIAPSADWTGSLDPDSGAMTMTAPLNAIIDLSGLGLGATCPIGPITLNWTTGQSGATAANHGTPYDASTGTAGLDDATFAIPAVQTAPAPAGCSGAATLNSLAPLPVAAGVSTAVFTATITPHQFGSTTTTASTTTTVPPALPPTAVSVGNAAILEGDVGTHTLKIPVTRSDTTNGNGTVHYAVTTNTAKSTDFTTVSGNLSFSGSTMQKTISVTVKGDKTSESNETMKVKLTSPSAGYALGRDNGVGTILNDDVHSKLTVGAGDIGVVVGDAGNQTLSFPITLSKAVTTKVTMHYVVSGITAVAGAGHDFGGTLSGTVSIAAGSRQGAANVTVFPHPAGVANKTLKVTLSSLHAPTASSFVRAVGKGTLFPSPVIFSIN